MPHVPTLKRALGPLQSYATLIGILVGAGIFRLDDAYALSGPSIVLGYLVLAPVVLAAAVPYAGFHSTSLAPGPGGDYAHIRAVFGSGALAGLAGWLKLISYLGAMVYLALALAKYGIDLLGLPSEWDQGVATLCLLAFYLVHSLGVTWFGRAQVVMCTLLGISILVLVVPGMFAIEVDNLQPFFRGGSGGFLQGLPILFFAYAGFESIAHNAAEIKGSGTTLPRVYMRGVLITVVIFFSMSLVVVGVLGEAAMQTTEVPMAAAARQYLYGASAIVAFGGVMATATSINATMAVPARLAMTLSRDGLLPQAFSTVHPGSRVPVAGLTVFLLVALTLLWTGQHGLALKIAVLALLCVYALHCVAFLWLPRRRPGLAAQVSIGLPRSVQKFAVMMALVLLSGLVGTLVFSDLSTAFSAVGAGGGEERAWTSTELILWWALLGWVVMRACRWARGAQQA